MNFFSVFSDSPPQCPSPNPDSPMPPPTSAWNFSSLLQNLSTKSDTLIGSYRRDLAEFSSGLRHETALISRALPLSLDAAQESLESVGQAIDEIGGAVSHLLSQGKEALSKLDGAADGDYGTIAQPDHGTSSSGIGSGGVGEKYSRYAAQLRAIQGDVRTYLDEPGDAVEFGNWRSGFVLEDRGEEVERLLSGGGVVREIYGRVVPGEVDRDVFWGRYFYRVYKLDKAEDARARLVKRAMSCEDEEDDLRWDFEDDDDKSGGDEIQEGRDGGRLSTSEAVESDDKKSEGKECKMMEKDNGGESSCKDSDMSIVSSQPSMPEVEDLGWVEIEDVANRDENKRGEGVSRTRRTGLRKRLSSAEEDEYLSWDIEDEDDSHKP